METYWYVYILECNDKSYYTGITNSLKMRMNAHKKGTGSKYVRARGFKELLKSKICLDKSQAIKFESQIKQLPKNKKLAWFDKN